MRNFYLYLMYHNWDYKFAGVLIATVLIMRGYL